MSHMREADGDFYCDVAGELMELRMAEGVAAANLSYRAKISKDSEVAKHCNDLAEMHRGVANAAQAMLRSCASCTPELFGRVVSGNEPQECPNALEFALLVESRSKNS